MPTYCVKNKVTGESKEIKLSISEYEKWREENPEKPSNTNIRDYASIDELIVLLNLEVLNSKMIDNQIPKKERFQALKESTIKQLQIFSNLKPIEL